MKKETKRYMLVEYAGSRETRYKTRQKVDEMYANIAKYNDDPKATFICGNISEEEINGEWVIIGHYYTKLTPKSTITEIDEMTSKYTHEELIAGFLDKTKFPGEVVPDINVAYFFTDNDPKIPNPLKVGIKYVPVMLKGDEKYMDIEYIKKCLRYHANDKDITFFQKLANTFYSYHTADIEVDKLFDMCDKVEHQEYLGYNRNQLYDAAYNLFKKIIFEPNKTHGYKRDENGRPIISRRRLRDFAMFIRDYGMPEPKSPLKYNGSLIHVKLSELKKAKAAALAQKGQQLKLI